MSDQIAKIDATTALEPADAAPVLRSQYEAAQDFLRAAVAKLDELALANPDDVDGLAAVLLIANRIDSDLDTLGQRVTNLLWKAMPDKRVTVDGIGVIERTVNTKSQWDQDETWKRALACIASRLDDPDEEMRPVLVAVDTIRQLQSPGQWRKTAFAAEGIDVADEGLCETTWGKRTIRFYRGTE